jgi:hypothetical protein
MKHMLHGMVGALALTLSVSAPLLAEETVSECQDRVIAECAAAMEDSNWAERVALGVVCSARLLGCSTINITIRPF